MLWTKPHISKIYEALGAIADKRIELVGTHEAKMSSSSGNKAYTVTWTDDFTQMMSNDNSAFYTGQLSYPMIAVLLLKGQIKYDPEVAEMLKGVKWKDINQKFKNNFDKTVAYVQELLQEKGSDTQKLIFETKRISDELDKLEISRLGDSTRPSEGY